MMVELWADWTAVVKAEHWADYSAGAKAAYWAVQRAGWTADKRVDRTVALMAAQ